jgi:hypothetical protein
LERLHQVCNHPFKASFFLSRINTFIKDRYFLPGREHGNLIDVAVTIFDKNVFGNEIKRQIYINCFADSIKIVRIY